MSDCRAAGSPHDWRLHEIRCVLDADVPLRDGTVVFNPLSIPAHQEYVWYCTRCRTIERRSEHEDIRA